LNSCFPGMLLKYFLNNFETLPAACITIGITFCCYIPHALNFYCKVFKFLNFMFFSLSYFYLLKLRCLVTHTFTFHYNGLWYHHHKHHCEQLITLRMSDTTFKYRTAAIFLNVDLNVIFHIYTYKPVDIFTIYLHVKF
jgi:hypothetical protein